MGCRLTIVDDVLNKSFYKLGLVVGRQPGYFIIIPLLLTLLMITGYQRIHYEMDPEYLFSPVSGQGKYERRIVEENFKVNYSHRFNVGRITRAGRFGRVIIVAKDNNTNMLRTEVWKELRQLDELVQNMTVTMPNGDTFTYKEECARWEGQCFTNDILNLDKIIGEVERGELNLTFPIMFNPVTWEAHAFPVFFGGSKVVDDIIESVPAVQLVWFVRTDTKAQLEGRGAAWEDAFLDTVGIAEDTGRFKHISVARFASRTLDHELEKNTRTVIPFFSSTFILMGIFSIVTCMMGDWVRSKPWLGLLGNISAVMATAAAFGCAIYLGISFIGINLAAPFLMIGIGIDDTFVMLAAWRRASPKLPVPERMAIMLSEAAVSITITSVTDMLSFFIGIFSPFPSVQIFCMYSGLAVCFTFVWHLTFFAGCVAISGYREKQNRHTITWMKVLPPNQRAHTEKVVISGEYNYSDPKIQDQVEALTKSLENTSYISNSLYTESWLRTFVDYVSRNNDYLNVTIDNEDEFIQNLKELWLFPANPFSLDVRFNEAGNRIIASRFLVQAVNISGTNHEKEMVKALREVVAQSPLNASVFHPYFVFFDQFELVRPTSLQNLSYGALNDDDHVLCIHSQYPVFLIYGDDKDLGIGTSGEDTSESSSNQSQRRQIGEDENSRKKYDDGWKRSSYCQNSSSQFQPSGELDLYGHDMDRNWQRQRYEDNRRVFDNYRKPPTVSRTRDDDWVSSTRKSSDAGQRREGAYRVTRAHSHHNIHRSRAPRRSNSHHNLEHLDYVAEMRFP
ncbi:hypothetical protein HF086_010098 [Spodoptera exigua]|uniref:SSD domain-containing protein n=1 Tax=Spodoptera exigua TaxID=7107 RepID=A0A922MZR0_SPOEX|nr:hypothetical protein HF086_010098 [Spodoptera exigua]